MTFVDDRSIHDDKVLVDLNLSRTSLNLNETLRHISWWLIHLIKVFFYTRLVYSELEIELINQLSIFNQSITHQLLNY